MSSDGGEVAIRFTSQQQEKLWGDITRTVAELAKLQGQGEEMAQTTGRASASLRRFAESVKAAQATPDSRLAEEMAKIDAAVKASLLSEEQAAAARTAAQEKYQAEITKSAAAAQELAKAQRSEEVNTFLRQQIALVRERGGELQKSRDEAKAAVDQERRDLDRVDAEWERYAAGVKEALQTPIQTYHAKLEKLSEAHLRGKLTIDEYHTAAKRAFTAYKQGADGAAKSQESLGVEAVATGTIVAEAWQGALSAVQRISAAMREEHQKAIAAQRDAGGSLGMLAQISDTPEQMQQLSALARDLVRTGAAPDVSAGAQVVFDLANANALDQVDQLRQLAEPKVIRDLPRATTAANAVRSAMGSEVGSVTDIIAKSLKAAQFSAANAEQLAAGAARAGSDAAAKGMSVDELLAATGIIGDVRGSAEEGGTRLASLLRGMQDDREVRGMSLRDSILAIQSRGLQPEELTKQLTAEGVDAFRILATNLQKLQDVTKATAEQVTTDTFAEKRRIAMIDPSVPADMLARQSAGEATLAREAEGRVQQLVEAAISTGELERRTGAREGLVSRTSAAAANAAEQIQVLDKLGPAGWLLKQNLRAVGSLRGSVANNVDAMIFGEAMRTVGAAPGSKLPEAIAGSERTAAPVAEALLAAIKERDRENARFAEQVRAAGEKLDRAAAALERSAARVDRTGQARREAAVAAGGG